MASFKLILKKRVFDLSAIFQYLNFIAKINTTKTTKNRIAKRLSHRVFFNSFLRTLLNDSMFEFEMLSWMVSAGGDKKVAAKWNCLA